ncbi:MAG: PDDEXK nuclease domain-containing protein [Oscillospiraceae bacterium]|jgi:predicted nuclease of restriction endonuclease-like (RecB) superfamily|nr:PDDEXK nuclease domain-containing protein [Oscillospiraceae bacterium]
MGQLIKIEKEYALWINELSNRFKSMQIKAATKVNQEMLAFYWMLGNDIVKMQAEQKWGSSFFATLSVDLRAALPNQKGFSETNLRYIKNFYILYSKESPQLVGKTRSANLPQIAGDLSFGEISPQFLDELCTVPWGHHRYIIDKCKDDAKKALFYVRKTVENNWSRAVLLNWLDTDLYERQGKAISNFTNQLPSPQGDLAQEITKDPYNFDFLTMREGFDERELKDSLTNNIVQFLMELGSGFAFVGREYRLVVGQTEKFCDLLFYNINLHCYVVVEVKIDKFESEYIGQLGTYVTAVNHILKSDVENPTIGILICKEKDNVLAQYALESSSQPIGVSEYELSKLYPTDFKGSLPSIEEIERQLK